MKFFVPSFLRIIPVLALLLSGLQGFAINYNDYGTSNRYDLYSGDTLFIQSGTYTGYIGTFNPNAVIVVRINGRFQPLLIQNPRGIIINYGYSLINSFRPSADHKFINYGTLRVTSSCVLTTNNNWQNSFGALIEVDTKLEVNASTFINSGEIKTGSMEINLGSAFTNRNKIYTTSTFAVNGGSNLINLGLIDSKGGININVGTYQNDCQSSVAGNFNNFATFINRSIITISNGNTFNNYNTLNLSQNGTIKATNFTNFSQGTITGSGSIYLTGTTMNGGSVGTPGNTTDTIKIYDATRNGSAIFDANWGTIQPNVAFRNMTVPDPEQYKSGCAVEYAGAVPLDVQWESFTISDANGRPNLTWKAAYLANTTFTVERSNDNQLFTPTFTTNARQDGQYNWIDETATGLVVFYRIKATESTGQVSYSETKRYTLKVKGNERAKVYPSPFSSTFQWSYIANEQANITFFIRSACGQTLLQKTAKVSKGQNTVLFTELGNLPTGMYWLETYNGNEQLSVHQLTKK